MLQKNATDSMDRKKSNAQVLREANTSRALLGVIKKRKLQYFGHIVRQSNSLEKDILLGMTNGKRKRGQTKNIVDVDCADMD